MDGNELQRNVSKTKLLVVSETRGALPGVLLCNCRWELPSSVHYLERRGGIQKSKRKMKICSQPLKGFLHEFKIQTFRKFVPQLAEALLWKHSNHDFSLLL